MSKASEAAVKAASRILSLAGVYAPGALRYTPEAEEIIDAAADQKYKPLVDVAQRIADWLESLAVQSDKQAADKRFPSLADASAADAKNYRATAKSILVALKGVKGE